MGSGGERNPLIGHWLGEGLPAVNFPHPDLARSAFGFLAGPGLAFL